MMKKKKDNEHAENKAHSHHGHEAGQKQDPPPEAVDVSLQGVAPEKALERIRQLEAELAEKNDKYLRLNADFDNYRKRTLKEVSGARFGATIDAILPFLKVFDFFNMAMAASESTGNMEAMRDGMKMILGEFSRALNDLGVERVEAVGRKFDPNLHDAISNEPSDSVAEGNVIKQWSCGYKMGDKLIRPATVVVSSGAAGAEGGDPTLSVDN